MQSDGTLTPREYVGDPRRRGFEPRTELGQDLSGPLVEQHVQLRRNGSSDSIVNPVIVDRHHFHGPFSSVRWSPER
jgi:hypothetical protein